MFNLNKLFVACARIKAWLRNKLRVIDVGGTAARSLTDLEGRLLELDRTIDAVQQRNFSLTMDMIEIKQRTFVLE